MPCISASNTLHKYVWAHGHSCRINTTGRNNFPIVFHKKIFMFGHVPARTVYFNGMILLFTTAASKSINGWIRNTMNLPPTAQKVSAF